MTSQFPGSQLLKKHEGEILIKTFRLVRPNLLTPPPSGPIYKYKIVCDPRLAEASSLLISALDTFFNDARKKHQSILWVAWANEDRSHEFIDVHVRIYKFI